MSPLFFQILSLVWLGLALFALLANWGGDKAKQAMWGTRGYIMLAISAVYTVGGTILNHLP